MSGRKTVLFFLPNSVGGAERVTINIAKALDPLEYEAKFYIVGKHTGDIASFIPERYDVGLIKVINIWDFAITKLMLCIKREKPWAVFSSIRYLNLRVILASSFFHKVKTVVRSNHNMYVFSAISRFWMRLLYPLADIVVAQQKEMAEEMLDKIPRLVPEQVYVLNNPIDYEGINTRIERSISPYDSDKVNFVCVGRLSIEKGQDVLVKAFAGVKHEIPQSHLYFVGRINESTEYYKRVLQLVESLQLTDSVRFIGHTDNPYIWIKYANTFVLPSRTEGLPNVLLEAKYLGTPIVATRCIPAIERIVSDYSSSILVPPEDSRSLAEAMCRSVSLARENAKKIESDNVSICRIFC